MCAAISCNEEKFIHCDLTSSCIPVRKPGLSHIHFIYDAPSYNVNNRFDIPQFFAALYTAHFPNQLGYNVEGLNYLCLYISSQ